AVLEQWRARFSVKEKGRADLVTEADVGAQEAIRTYLHDRFPSHEFLGEEGPGVEARPSLPHAPLWIVDPLDGTTNYVHALPLYAVSIGLLVGGELVVGVILEPSRNELFWAAKGEGAWLNDRRLQVSATAELGEALLATGFPPDLRGQEVSLRWWNHF